LAQAQAHLKELAQLSFGSGSLAEVDSTDLVSAQKAQIQKASD
jgi:hypothetical protein